MDSLNEIETTAPPAVSSLRSKFEQLTVENPSVPSSKSYLGLRSPNLATPRPRYFSGDKEPSPSQTGDLRTSASFSDLKASAKRPPPPPPPRTPQPIASPSPARSPLLRPVPVPPTSPSIAQNGLPPSVSPGKLAARLGAEAPAVPPRGGVATLRNVFVRSPVAVPPRVVTPVPLPKPMNGNGLSQVIPPEQDLLDLYTPPIPPRHQSSAESLRTTRIASPFINNIDQVLNSPPVDNLVSLSNDSESDGPEITSPPLPPRRNRPPTGHLSPESELSSSSSVNLTANDSDIIVAESYIRAPPMRPSVTLPPPPPPRPPAHREAPLVESPSSLSPMQTPPPLPVRRGTAAHVEETQHSMTPPPRLPHRPLATVAAEALPPLARNLLKAGRHPPPPTRTIGLGEKLPPARRAASPSSDEEEEDEPVDQLPDSSHSSRRAPSLHCFKHNDARIAVQAHNGIAAVAGDIVVVASHHHIKVYDLSVSSTPVRNWDTKALHMKDSKLTCIEFRPAARVTDRGLFVWLGTKEGHVFEMDVRSGMLTAAKFSAHGHHVSHIFRHGRSMITLDGSGKALIFTPDGVEDVALTGPAPRVYRIAEKQEFVKMLGGLLWTATRSDMIGGHAMKVPVIRIYDIFTPGSVSRPVQPTESVGAVTSGTVLPFAPQKVYLGHERGFITVWSVGASDGVPHCTDVVKVSVSDVLSLEGVGERIWAGGRMGAITVYDVSSQPWNITNCWNAHPGGPVQKLFADPYSIEKLGRLSVVSIGRDEQLRLWDGLLASDWIDQELLKREKSFSTFRPLKLLIVSWNIDAATPDALYCNLLNSNFLHEVLNSVDSPDIISFGFQETVDLESRRVTAVNLTRTEKKPSFEEGKVGNHLSVDHKVWFDKLESAVRKAMPHGTSYTAIGTEGLVGLYNCVFVKKSERAATEDVGIALIKRGLKGRYGNKGGIFSRFTIDDSSFCIVNCHLAAGQHHVRQRNIDVTSLIEGGRIFPEASALGEPIAYVGGGDGTMVMDHELVFFHGDMNYRIDFRRDNIIAAIEAGDLGTLIAHDQLMKEMKLNRAFRLRTFTEGPLTFAPTYKYDRRSTEYDTSEKRRLPAWCDRILWRSQVPARVQQLQYRRWEPDISDHRPISAVFAVTVKSVNQELRAKVKAEVETIWIEHQKEVLLAAREFYVKQALI